MTDKPAPEAVEAVAHVIHDNAYYVDGSDVAAVAVVEFIRDAIHRDGDDADAIRQALGMTKEFGYGVLLPVEDPFILMTTYDGTAKEHSRWKLSTGWREVQP